MRMHTSSSDGEGGRQVRTLRGHSDCVTAVSFSPDGTRIVSGSHDNLVKIWNAETGSEVCVKHSIFPKGPNVPALSRYPAIFLPPQVFFAMIQEGPKAFPKSSPGPNLAKFGPSYGLGKHNRFSRWVESKSEIHAQTPQPELGLDLTVVFVGRQFWKSLITLFNPTKKKMHL